MKRTFTPRRGFTLLEMMVVVAVASSMAMLAAGAMSAMLVTGRVNGSSSSLSRALGNARLRALTMTCRTSVQVNGPLYTATAPPPRAPVERLSATVFMKANCASPNGWFEPGDRVISQFLVPGIQMEIPILSSAPPIMSNESVVFSWGTGPTGVLTRDVYLSTGGTFSPVTAAPPEVTVRFSVTPGFASMMGSSNARIVFIPDVGVPRLDP